MPGKVAEFLMPHSCIHVLNPVLGLISNVFVQVVSFRYVVRLGLLKSEVLGFLAGLLTVLTLELYFLPAQSTSGEDFVPILIVNFITYSSLGYCYFHFINLGETARRIRILRELYDSKEGLSMWEILQRYNAKDIAEVRINRLICNGQIIHRNGRYYIGNPIMLLIAKVIIMMKLIILGKRSEFN